MSELHEHISRRTILKGAAAFGGATMLTGCERITSVITDHLGEHVPDSVAVANSQSIDPVFHLLSRAAYGPSPGDLELVRKQGISSWLDEQLKPETINDTAADLRASRFETVQLDGGTCFEYHKDVLFNELVRQSIIKSVYSKRQLYQVMVEFWTDHFNIDMSKGNCAYYKGADDHTVARKHALGKFRDLVRASAVSPAMLVYLDGNENKKATAQDIPNENYARELLELHTLGVHGGYTQKDVAETARCLTGWRIHDSWQRGKVYFTKELHDDGAKQVLGQTINSGGGENDLERVIDIACSHPSTAVHISRKLVRKFVSDNPPESLVTSAAQEFTRTGGDIKSVLRHILTSDQFTHSAGLKIKRPFQFIVSSLRSVGADTYAHNDLIEYLKRMGQCPYQYPTPDGYPDKPQPWMATLLWRWNFALALTTNKIPSVHVSLDKLIAALGAEPEKRLRDSILMSHLVGRQGTPLELSALKSSQSMRSGKSVGSGESVPSSKSVRSGESAKSSKSKSLPDDELIGLIISSPAFQRC